MELTFHQAHSFFDADLPGGKTVENSTAVSATIILRCATQRGHDLVQATARCVIGDI